MPRTSKRSQNNAYLDALNAAAFENLRLTRIGERSVQECKTVANAIGRNLENLKARMAETA
jgi:hypothetical protein